MRFPTATSALIAAAGSLGWVAPVALADTTTVEPSTVVVTLTRQMGPFAGANAAHVSSTERVWVRMGTSAPTASTGLLASDSGHQAIAEFALDSPQPRALPSGVEQGHVRILGVPSAGLYKGSLQIAPTVSVDVELKAQDSILWPVLVVFIGALIGGGGTAWWAARRRRELLKARFLDALDRYERGQAEQPEGTPQYVLKLPRRSDLPRMEWIPSDGQLSA